MQTNDFINEVEQSSGENLDGFVQTWLMSNEFNLKLVKKSLEKARSLKDKLPWINTELTHVYYPDFKKTNNSFKQSYYIYKASENKEFINFNQFCANAFEVNDLKVRQAIASCMLEIPIELKEKYESLLNDKSYLTVEMALFNLWKNFPMDKSKYLDKTKDIEGLNNKNVRILWLVLALNTPDYELNNKHRFFEELRGYTGANYHFEIRQNAFNYLNLMQSCDAICEDNLEQATKHHNWRFSKFAKEMLSKIKKSE